MREEKRSEIIHDALNFLDDEMIDEVENLRGGFVTTEETMVEKSVTEMKKKAGRKNISWKKWTALAAGIGFFIMIGGIWDRVTLESHDMNNRPEDIEGIFENAEIKDEVEKDNADDVVDSDATFEGECEDFMESIKETEGFTEMENSTEIEDVTEIEE